MVFSKNDHAPILAPALGALFLFVCSWVLVKSLRLIFGLQVQGGLLGPIGLQISAWLFLLLPLAGFFTGYFRSHPIRGGIQAASYIAVFFGIRALNAERRQNDA
jgi:hypothetical protein